MGKHGIFATILPAALGVLLTALFATPQALRADEPGAQDAQLREISVIGSRRPVRTAADAPSAVDIIEAEDFSRQASMQVPEMLRKLVPSYNVATQPISDASTFIRPANLRGLAPDQTLVLVNGKRRHRAAVISWLGNGVAEGAHGPDISVIPAIGLKRIEILRDTASVQYGSDAIAGVMNFVLKDRPQGGTIEAQWGQTYSGDGDEYRVSGNLGLPLGADGFANLSAQWHEMGPTVRSIQRADAQGLIDNGNDAVRTPYAQVWGQPDVDDDYTVFLNSGMKLAGQTELYAFGNVSERETEGGFFFRNPNTRSGVFANSGVRLALADGCPTDLAVSAAADELFDWTPYPGCFFNERFPGGFTPKFGAEVSDASGSAGMRGELASGLTWDASYTLGESEADFTIRNTVNASLGLRTPTTFRLGQYTQTEQTLSLDMTRVIGTALPLHTAFGVEWREEEFEVSAGEPDSWRDGGLGTTRGAGVGANGFSGFSELIAGKWDRSSTAAYVEFEADATNRLTLAVMGRIEDHEDYDVSEDFKLGALFRATEAVSLRGSVSTGFRVPTVGQENVANVTTAFTNNETTGRRELTQRGTIPSKCPEAAAVGAEKLDAEESLTYTAGFGIELGGASFTVDAYQIEVDDRLGLSQNKVLSAAQKAAIGSGGCFAAADVTNFRFFGNGFDTRTRGIDVTASFDVTGKLPWLAGGQSELLLVANYNDTEVTRHNPDFIGEQRISQLEDALPQLRFNITLGHDRAHWSSFVRLNYFGSYEEFHADIPDLFIEPDEEFTLDLEMSYRPTDGMAFSIGAENVTDNFPDRNKHASELGSKYPESSPMGFAGGFYYARARYDW